MTDDDRPEIAAVGEPFELDLTEAVEAAARAHWERISEALPEIPLTPWDALDPSVQLAARDEVLPIVQAVAPIIALQVDTAIALNRLARNIGDAEHMGLDQEGA